MVRHVESSTLRAALVFALASTANWAGQTVTLPAKQADRIVVEKSARTMKLMRGAEVLKTYKVALSREPVGPKEREGDHKVPEGQYEIDSKNSHSRFHLALHVSYPNAADRERARKLGVKPGGNIEIHGLARIPEGDGYRLVTVEKKRGAFVKPPDNTLAFYLRYMDGTKRRLVPAGKLFPEAVVKAINIETVQNATRNGHQAPAVEVTAQSERLTITDAVARWLGSFETRLAQWRGGADNGLSKSSIAAYTKTAKDFLAYCNQRGIVFMPKTDKTGQQAQQVRLGWQSTTPGGLDGWVHRRDQLGDRGNLAAGQGRDSS